MLDEPLSALDSFLKWQLEQEILRLRDGFRALFCLFRTTGTRCFRLCDRVIVMENGKTQKTQSKQELFYDPQTLSAALLSGCKNTSRAKKTERDTLFAFDWNISLESEKPVPDDVQYVGFRAHYFEIAEGPGGANTLSCGVGRVLDDVFSTIVTVNIEDAKESAGPSLRWDLSKEKWDQLAIRKRFI